MGKRKYTKKAVVMVPLLYRNLRVILRQGTPRGQLGLLYALIHISPRRSHLFYRTALGTTPEGVKERK